MTQFMSFHKNLSDPNEVWARRGRSSTWTPHASYVWKMSIFCLYHGLELVIIQWSHVILYALCCEKGIFHGAFVISCYWIFFKTSTWHFIIFITDMFPGYYVTFYANLHFIMIIGLHLIPIDFSTPHLKTEYKFY